MSIELFSLSLMIFAGTCIATGVQTAFSSELEEKDRVVKIGSAVSNSLLKSLKIELVSVMSTSGVEQAINFCSEKALPLTEKVAVGSDEVVTLKRTSFRYRNPKNAPDELEKKALSFFEAAIASGKELPQYLIQKGEAEAVYRYYKPLRVEAACLSCHGAKENILPGVRAAIESRYPQDGAFGYKVGDFRGVVSVSIPKDALKDRVD